MKEISYMLLSEITVEQFIRLIGTIVFIVLIYIFVIVPFINFIVDYVHGIFRKDKYKSTDFAVIEAYRYISRLRKQVKCAPNAEAYVTSYYRLFGAVAFLVHMGYISSKASSKILDVPPNYESELIL